MKNIVLGLLMLAMLTGCQKSAKVEITKVEGPGTSVEASWDLSKSTYTTYESGFQERQTSSVNNYKTSPEEFGSAHELVLSSTGDGTATLKFKENDKPEILIDGMSPDGLGTKPLETKDMMILQTLLLLPEEKMEIGQSISRKHSLPVIALLEGKGELRGKRDTTFEGYYELEGVVCAKFTTEYKYSRFVDTQGNPHKPSPFELEGTSTTYYDADQKNIMVSLAEAKAKTVMVSDLGNSGTDAEIKFVIQRQ